MKLIIDSETYKILEDIMREDVSDGVEPADILDDILENLNVEVSG